METTHRGGAMWRQGADTCVFNPAVRCNGETERREGISRVRKAGDAGRDFVVEHRIRTSFPKLVENGSVIVYDELCGVNYDDEDMKSEVEGTGACSSLDFNEDAANFVTPKMDGSIREYFEANPKASQRKVLQPAALTAVEMVPDAGPWVVHMDLHLGNVLYKREAKGMRVALADWGRALIIVNPSDIESVRKGIRGWMEMPADTPVSVLQENLAALDWPIAKHASALLTGPIDDHLPSIRGWAVYTLLGSSNPALLTAKSQAELRSMLKLGGQRTRRKRGGKRWKQGMDTCVFDPAVACADGTPIPDGSISRVRTAKDAERDILIEETIKKIPAAAAGVVVHSVTCTPSYVAEDIEISEEIEAQEDLGGCDTLGDIKEGPNPGHVNLVTPKWEMSLGRYMATNPGAPWRKVLKSAVRAAVALVPDAGPWVVHADCHLGNVLVRTKPLSSAISDWGRAIVVESPEKIKEGVREWLKSVDPTLAADPSDTACELALRRFPDLPQYPRVVLASIRMLFEEPYDTALAIKRIRGWMPYVLFKQVAGSEGSLFQDAVAKLLDTESQADLEAKCIALFAVKGGRKTRRGGAMWKEGADACVFKPSVTCSPGEVPMPGHVSRILGVGYAESHVRVEEDIRALHPDIVGMKLVSIHTRKCTPHYTPSDTGARRGEEGGACRRLGVLNDESAKNHVNLIAPEMDVGTLSRYFDSGNPVRYRNWRNVLLGAMTAAVAFVPDDKKWIVHGDVKPENVLLWRSPGRSWPVSALADWGLAVVIKDPNDLKSVRAGIQQYAFDIGWIRDVADVAAARTAIENVRREPVPQIPAVISATLKELLTIGEDEKEAFKRAMNRIRGWVPYVLVEQALPGGDRMIDRDTGVAININDLLTQPNQAELEKLVTRILNSLPSPGVAGFELEPLPRPPPAGGMYWPAKYSKGLTRRQNAQRKRSATRRKKMKVNDPKAYVPWKSDTGAKTRRSSYTSRFHSKYPGVKTLPEIAKATGVSKSVLEKVYDRGMAAWRTGHRPGASQQAWGMARVHSFVLKGKTYRTADADLA